jgi:hypothetical protein
MNSVEGWTASGGRAQIRAEENGFAEQERLIESK